MEWSGEVEQGAWIGKLLDDFATGTITSRIPHGFEAYARVLHPLRGPRGGEQPVRWSDVAAWSGVALLPGTRYRQIAIPERVPAESPPWDLSPPEEGMLVPRDSRALVGALAEHTDPGMRCWFALWEGWGWLEHWLPPKALDAPRLQVPYPYRSHVLFCGELPEALVFAREDHEGPGPPLATPALWWPQDRSWCVATEIDDDVTYVAGSHELIARVHADPGLETQPAAAGERAMLPLPEDWLAGLLGPGAERVLRDGEASVETAVGTLLVRLTSGRSGGRELEVMVVGLARWRHQPIMFPLAGTDDHVCDEITAALRRSVPALLY